MSTNVTFLGDIADWYDAQTNRVIELRNGIFHWADPRGYSGCNTVFSPIGLWAAWGDALIHMSQGVMDTLRIGNGLRDARRHGLSAAGAWGVTQDVLRASNLWLGGGRVIRGIGNVLRVSWQGAGTVTCVVHSLFNALEITGNANFFINIRHLMRSAGISESALISAGGTTQQMLRQLVNALRMLQIETESLRVGLHQLGWEALEGFAQIRTRGVFLVCFHYASQAANATRSVASEGHALLATFSREYGLIFQDTNGRVYAGLAALRRVYPEATVMRDYPIVFIRSSTMTTRSMLASGAAGSTRAAAQASGDGSLLENIVVPVVAVVSEAFRRE